MTGFVGRVSAIHTNEEVETTIIAFGKVLDAMITDGVFGKQVDGRWTPI